jgi:hypothetical protein
MLVTARSHAEYLAMFGLDGPAVEGLVVDCCAGASDFVAEVAARGGRALAVDPVYALPRGHLLDSATSGAAGAGQLLADHADRFVWRWYGSLERRERLRTAAAARFVEDIARRPRAYLAAGLPSLPLADRVARLVLCSHLLFTWSDRFGVDWHRAALAEMLRVTGGEVRVFPLVVQGTGEPVPFLGQLVDELRSAGCEADVRRVPYEFQRGADAMLRVAHPRVARP